MTSDELTLWAAFAGVEPFGPRQEELRAGAVAAAAASAWGNRARPEDFFPSLRGGTARGSLRLALVALCPALTPMG